MDKIAQYKIKTSQFRNNTRYTLLWSPYFKMDRFVINQHIPSEAGIYQLFIKRSHHLQELESDIAYYGGIRGTMREMTDELSPRVFKHKQRVLDDQCFCRFVTCPHMKIMEVVLAYLRGTTEDSSKIEVAEKDHLGLVLN